MAGKRISRLGGLGPDLGPTWFLAACADQDALDRRISQSAPFTIGNPCGVSGAKGGDQGECGPAKQAPDQSRIGVSQLLARIRHIVAVDTRGGSRMRERCTYGSVRGARGNSRPYRDEGAKQSWRDQPVQVRPR